jgi:hypothetical protein
MTDDELDLSAEAYAPIAASDVRVGDICAGIGLPDLADTNLYETQDLPGRLAVAARIVYALVVSLYEGYVVVVPITTADVASDQAQFAAVVASGHDARWWMRLPALEDAWPQDAVALLFMPQTLADEAVVNKRMAAMHPPAREIVARRFSRALSGDGD